MATVVDLTGPSAVYATRLLVEAGHRVIRVEPPGGDAVRRMGPRIARDVPELEASAYHGFHNAGKESLALDPSRPGRREVLLRLLTRADAVVATVPVPLEPDEMLGAAPALAVVVVDDEDEITAYARSGLLSITGHPGSEPVVLGGHIVNSAIGVYVALAASAAMRAAATSGVSQTARVSVRACLESLMEQPMVTYLTTGTVNERRGLRGAITAVSGAFRCKDGYWMVSTHGSGGWERLVEWIGDPVLAGDPTLTDERARLRRRDEILDRITEWSAGRTRDEIVTEAQRRHIPASPVVTPLDLVDDPQLEARGALRAVDHPLFGRIAFPQGAVAVTRGTSVGPAPLLGQHTAALLDELGYTGDEQRALRSGGVA